MVDADSLQSIRLAVLIGNLHTAWMEESQEPNTHIHRHTVRGEITHSLPSSPFRCDDDDDEDERSERSEYGDTDVMRERREGGESVCVCVCVGICLRE